MNTFRIILIIFTLALGGRAALAVQDMAARVHVAGVAK